MTRTIPSIVLLAVAVAPAAGEDYPRPDFLVEPATLVKPGGAKAFVILDVRSREEYTKGHVSGARWVDHAEWAKEFGDGRDAEGWGKRIGRLGIGSDSTVVVYDDSRSKDAARIWWVLRYWGVRTCGCSTGVGRMGEGRSPDREG
jgi:thiosulfate/3-mercaptopyruvate sulfurtransferase